MDECTCIGCINCANVCPKTFEIEQNFGRARVHSQDADSESDIQEAIDTCPVNCIHRVGNSYSIPPQAQGLQLHLLGKCVALQCCELQC